MTESHILKHQMWGYLLVSHCFYYLTTTYQVTFSHLAHPVVSLYYPLPHSPHHPRHVLAAYLPHHHFPNNLLFLWDTLLWCTHPPRTSPATTPPPPPEHLLLMTPPTIFPLPSLPYCVQKIRHVFLFLVSIAPIGHFAIHWKSIVHTRSVCLWTPYEKDPHFIRCLHHNTWLLSTAQHLKDRFLRLSS